MKKTTSLLLGSALLLGNASLLHAQLLNGSFSSGFADWTTVGGSATTSGGISSLSTAPGVTAPTPLNGTTTQAVLQSTDGDTAGAISATATALNAALTTTLPATPDTDVNDPYFGDPGTVTNGQAIVQSFSVAGATLLSFDYSFQTNDEAPFDAVGYVVDGIFTKLPNTGQAWNADVISTPTAYTTVKLSLGAGTHTLGFVSYNTAGHSYSTSLYLTNIETTEVPEPATWALFGLALAGLLSARIVRSQSSVS